MVCSTYLIKLSARSILSVMFIVLYTSGSNTLASVNKCLKDGKVVYQDVSCEKSHAKPLKFSQNSRHLKNAGTEQPKLKNFDTNMFGIVKEDRAYLAQKNPYIFNGKYNQNASSRYIEQETDALGEFESISVAAWVRHNGAPFKTSETIVSKGDSAFRLHLNNGCYSQGLLDNNVRYGFTFGIRQGCEDADLNSNIVPISRKWYHVAGIYDGSDMAIYINGIKKNEASVTGNIKDNGFSLLAGESHQTKGRVWQGDIVGLAVWEFAISNEQLKKHLESTRP